MPFAFGLWQEISTPECGAANRICTVSARNRAVDFHSRHLHHLYQMQNEQQICRVFQLWEDLTISRCPAAADAAFARACQNVRNCRAKRIFTNAISCWRTLQSLISLCHMAHGPESVKKTIHNAGHYRADLYMRLYMPANFLTDLI